MVLVYRLASFALVAAVLMTCASSLAHASPGESLTASLDLTPRGSINIFGNEDFTEENGVVSGSGKSGDPYIIEGWEMVYNNTGTGITVVMTDKYFVVRNVHIINAKLGIRLEGVYHARITESLIADCLTGITATYSEVSKVDNNEISNCSLGVSLRYCDAFDVTDNDFVDNDEDLRVVALPWIETRQADMVFGIIAACMFAFVALLIYIRYKSSRPPEERP